MSTHRFQNNVELMRLLNEMYCPSSADELTLVFYSYLSTALADREVTPENYVTIWETSLHRSIARTAVFSVPLWVRYRLLFAPYLRGILATADDTAQFIRDVMEARSYYDSEVERILH